MKQLSTFLLMLLMSTAAMAQVTLTFRVDMSAETVSPNGVHVAGNWQDDAGYPGEWDPSTAELTDPNEDGIYTLTVTLPAGTYEYKYINDNAWGNNEGGGLSADCGVDDGNGAFNRPAVIAGDSMLPAYVYNSCEVTAVTSIRGQAEVAFSVFPNPFSTQAVISFTNQANEAYQVQLLNTSGQVVRRYDNVRGSELTVEKGTLTAGLYLASFVNEAGQRSATRLLIN
jgi:hypothetical protein